MDPINILVGVNLIATMGANISSTKDNLKSSMTRVMKKPDSLLQKLPLNLAAFLILLQILGIFNLGTLKNFDIEYGQSEMIIRLIGLILFAVFSWLQIKSFKILGDNYSQEVVILKSHKLVQKGFYKYIRHPQYLFQMLADLGAGIALLSYLIIPVVLFGLIPLLIFRARFEEKLLESYFKDEFKEYKKKTGFFIPTIG